MENGNKNNWFVLEVGIQVEACAHFYEKKNHEKS